MKQILRLNDPFIYQISVNWPNLYFDIQAGGVHSIVKLIDSKYWD